MAYAECNQTIPRRTNRPGASHSCGLVKRPLPSGTISEGASENYGAVARRIERERTTSPTGFKRLILQSRKMKKTVRYMRWNADAVEGKAKW